MAQQLSAGTVRPRPRARRLRRGVRGRPARTPQPRGGARKGWPRCAGSTTGVPAAPSRTPVTAPASWCRSRTRSAAQVVDFDLPPAGQYATGLVFLPGRRTPGAQRACGCWRSTPSVEGAEILGWRDVPVDPTGLGATALAAHAPDPAGLPRRPPAHRRPPGRPARRCPAWSWSGWSWCVRKQTERETRQRGVPAYFPSLSSRTMVYKGMLTPDQLAVLLPGPVRPAGGRGDRAGALPVLHQHLPVLAAGPPVPADRPQRRVQHHPGQQELDGRPGGAAAQPRSSLATCAGCSRSATRTPPTRPTSTRCWSCCTSPGAACRTRC